MSSTLESILAELQPRIDRATISDDSKEELAFQLEALGERFEGATLEGKPLKDVLEAILDVFSLGYRLALADAGEE